MDFITGLPPSRSCAAILVMEDWLTKYSYFGPLPTQFSAAKVATLFSEIVIKHHGFPTSIVFDRDPIFLCEIWKTLFQLNDTKLHHSTAYHLQTDGQIEIVNRGMG